MMLYVPALWMAAGICLFAGAHFTLTGLPRREDRVYLVFGLLCLVLAAYFVFTSMLYRVDTAAAAGLVVRVQVALASLAYLLAVCFLSLYTGLKHWRPWVFAASVVFGTLAVWECFAPYSMLYSAITPRDAILLPWGENVSDFSTVESPYAWIYYVAENSAYVWSLWRCVALARAGRRDRAWPLALYLTIQVLAVAHGEVVNRTNERTVTYEAFAFLGLVLLMSDALRRELGRRSAALAESLAELRIETERRRAMEADLRHMAYHDQLTGLPNRRLLRGELERLLAARRARGGCGALILFDLDHFKTINDALGHSLGDELLRAVAERIRMERPDGAYLARLGGDEFALLLADLPGERQPAGRVAADAATELTRSLGAPMRIGDHELVVGASAGVAVFDAGQDADGVFRHADMALYRAKSSGRNTVAVFATQMQHAADRRLLLEKGLRQALARRELALQYQPQVDAAGKVVGAESLLRWRHPEYGSIPPQEFIPLAEETGLIHPIGRYVLQDASSRLVAWRRVAGAGRERLSVNISPWQLFAADFVTTVADAVSGETRALTLEITENAFLHDLEDVATKMRHLDEMGAHFSLDDFGSGHTSFASLQRLPLDELKIDRSLVQGLDHGEGGHFLEAMITIAHQLGLRVIAEGVETEEQRRALAAMRCDAFQGYLISKPLDEADFLGWLKRQAA